MIESDVFSIIIPTKDRPEMLRRALDSVYRQTVLDYELVVVDDGSAVELNGGIVADIERKGTYIRRQLSCGPSVARNIGLSAAQRDWVVFLDDDDELYPQYLERVRSVVQSADARIAWVGSKVKIKKYKNQHLVREKNQDWASGLEGKRKAYRELTKSPDTALVFSGVTVRTSSANQVRFNEALHSAVDRDFLIRLSKKGDLLSIDEELVLVHTHDGDKVNVYSEAKAIAYTHIIETNKDVFDKSRISRAKFERKAGWLFGKCGRRREALSYLAKSIKSWPYDHKTWILLMIYWLPGGLGGAFHKQASNIRKKL